MNRSSRRPKGGFRPLVVCWVLVVVVVFGFALSLHDAGTGALDLEFTKRLAKTLHIKYSQEVHHVDPPILEAAKAGNIDDVEVLVSSGVDVTVKDRRKDTVLHFLSGLQRDRIHTMKLVIESKGGKELVNARGFHGRTPLIKAAFNNLPRIIKLLLYKGAKVEITDDFSDGPLHEAARGHGGKEAMQLLLDGHPGLVNVPGHNRTTPLMYAAVANKPKVFEFLLGEGADSTLKDAMGATAKKVASTKCPGCLAVLKNQQ